MHSARWAALDDRHRHDRRGGLRGAAPRGDSVTRRVMSYILIPAAAALLSTVVYAVVLIINPDEDPETTPFSTVFFLRAATLILLSVGVGVVALRDWRTGREVALLADALGGRHRLPGRSGQRSPAHSATTISTSPTGFRPRSGTSTRPVGRSTRHPDPVRRRRPSSVTASRSRWSSTTARSRPSEIGAATRLTVDNEQLRAEVLAQLDDLPRLSDAHRRGRRRDSPPTSSATCTTSPSNACSRHRSNCGWHAGPLSRRATRRWSSGSRSPPTTPNTRWSNSAELAHGIFQAILAEAGLTALQTLASRSPVAVDMIEVPEQVPRRCRDGRLLRRRGRARAGVATIPRPSQP